MADRPIRLQLSRRRGFDLQALSMATNGLPAVNVARPSRWGNPHDWREWVASVKGDRGFPLNVPERASWAREQAVLEFRADIEQGVIKPDLDALRGKNLACWCGKYEVCHADVLIEMANIDEVTK